MRKISATTIIFALLLGGLSFAAAQTQLNSNPTVRRPGIAGIEEPATNSAGPVNTEAGVKQKLWAHGYTDITDIHKDKNGWTASARFNDVRISVLVDNLGQIQTH
jgi:hypothetical protein